MVIATKTCGLSRHCFGCWHPKKRFSFAGLTPTQNFLVLHLCTGFQSRVFFLTNPSSLRFWNRNFLLVLAQVFAELLRRFRQLKRMENFSRLCWLADHGSKIKESNFFFQAYWLVVWVPETLTEARVSETHVSSCFTFSETSTHGHSNSLCSCLPPWLWISPGDHGQATGNVG